jgi:biopolymer transport protein ExbD
MAVKIPATDDAGLNMTPMIDIVFQLILFFLFNLRFKSLDYRIESQLPKDRGLAPTPEMKADIPAIKVSLFRENAESKDSDYTKVKIAGVEYKLDHEGWTGNRAADMKKEDERDKRFAAIQAKITELSKANKDLKGEIETPLPKGAAVPHGDVMRVLDAFIGAGITEVNFVGTPQPIPSSARKATAGS